MASPNRYFSFVDFLDEEKYIHTGGFLLIALPPLLGGAILSFIPDAQAPTAGAAGLVAAFLGVWPILQHPYHLLDEQLQRFWPKLRLLYFIFVGSSAALAYAGYVIGTLLIPFGTALVGTSAWNSFVEDVAANALYDLAKFLVVSALSVAGYLAVRERNRIGETALERAMNEPKQQEDWHSDAEALNRRNPHEGFEETP